MLIYMQVIWMSHGLSLRKSYQRILTQKEAKKLQKVSYTAIIALLVCYSLGRCI